MKSDTDILSSKELSMVEAVMEDLSRTRVKTGDRPLSFMENETFRDVLTSILRQQKAFHQKGTTARRLFHAKSNGLVDGTVLVLPNIPDHLRKGMFAYVGREFNLRIRFSQGINLPDPLPNAHAAALELSDVPGEKLLPGDEQSSRCNIILIDDPRFLVKDIETMRELIEFREGAVKLMTALKSLLRKATWRAGEVLSTLKSALHGFTGALRHGLRSAVRSPMTPYVGATSLLHPATNPLRLTYHSQPPYALGNTPVKYVLAPIVDNSLPGFFWRFLTFDRWWNILDPDMLRKEASWHLQRAPARFVLHVQPMRHDRLVQDNRGAWSSEPGDSVDNPMIPWKGERIPVALLTIPRISEELSKSAGEALSFNPWRVPLENRPLHLLGWLRLAAYLLDFRWRSGENG